MVICLFYNVKGEKIYYINQLEGEKLLNMFLAGITLPNPAYKSIHNITRDNEFDKYQFEYVFKGKGYIETGDKKYTIQEGDFFFLNKLKPHIYYTDKNCLLEKIFITVNGKLVDHLLEAYDMTDSVIIQRVNVYNILKQLLDLLAHMTHENKQDVFNQIGLLILEMIQKVYYANLTVKQDQIPDENNEQIKDNRKLEADAHQIRNYIENNMDINLTLEQIATYFYRSKANIINIFKKEYNTTPICYALNRKIEISERMLSYTKLSINEIAAMLAFSSSKHFGKMFKKVHGMSPSEYRKINNKPGFI